MDAFSSNKFCFCIHIKTGCWIISFVTIVLTVLRMIYHVIEEMAFISCYDNQQWFTYIHNIWGLSNTFEFLFTLYFIHGLVVNDKFATLTMMAFQTISLFVCIFGTFILIPSLKPLSSPTAAAVRQARDEEEVEEVKVECPTRVAMSIDKFVAILIEMYMLFMVNSYRVYQKRFGRPVCGGQ